MRDLCIYIFANASMPGLFKVGITAMEVVQDRARHLYTTGVPTPFVCVRVVAALNESSRRAGGSGPMVGGLRWLSLQPWSRRQFR